MPNGMGYLNRRMPIDQPMPGAGGGMPPGPPAPPGAGGGMPPGGGGGGYDPRTREGRQQWVEAMNRSVANRPARADWSQADWNAALERAMRPQTRRGRNPGEWEYLVKGDWVDQATYDDPLWRKNVYEPWASDVRNQWRIARQEVEDWKKKYARRPSPFAPMGGRGGRGAGPVGSRGFGGGGGLSPEMMDMLIRGGAGAVGG